MNRIYYIGQIEGEDVLKFRDLLLKQGYYMDTLLVYQFWRWYSERSEASWLDYHGELDTQDSVTRLVDEFLKYRYHTFYNMQIVNLTGDWNKI